MKISYLGFDGANPYSLVIVNNLDVIGFPALLGPVETDSPLVVDSNAVLTGPVSMKRFEAVAGRYTQIEKIGSGIETFKSNESSSRHAGKFASMFSIRELFGIVVPEFATRWHY
jgi:hypothetical protein